MRTAKIVWSLGVIALTVVGPAFSASMQPGASLLAVQLTHGDADFATPAGPSGMVVWDLRQPELGVQLHYWYFLREEYGLNLSAGIGHFRERDTGDPSVFVGPNYRYTQNSWQVRLGGDRFAKVSEKLQVFAGPGVQVWGGKYKQELLDGGGEQESPTTVRWGLTGRVGAHIAIGKNFGFIGHVGHYWAYASAKDSGAEVKWLPSGSEGAMGFAFGF